MPTAPRETRARFVAMLLADARLPAGGSAHSSGLEGAVQAGLELADVPRYLEARLRSVATIDASGAVLAHRIASSWDESGEPRLRRLDRSLAARTPSAVMRASGRQLGRGLARVGLGLAPRHPAVRALGALSLVRPIALGVVAAALGLDEAGTALVVCYDEAQTIAAAALKLLPGDPVANAAWVLAAEEVANGVVAQALLSSGPESLPAPGAPDTEFWAGIHSQERRRLFVS